MLDLEKGAVDMHTITFFPLGNADSYRVDLENGRKLLIDYANVANPDDDHDLRVDLPSLLKADLKACKRDRFDVVAFTHADNDHVARADEFFYFDHADKYQGEGRIRIEELWVPASMVLESGLEDSARVIRQEARHRLKKGKGIRVFSRPDRLKEWLEGEGIKLDDRRHLIIDAGQIIPGFSMEDDGVEFFVHSPFARRVDDKLEDRNENSLVFQATFTTEGQTTRMLMTADTVADVWTDIVNITRYHQRDDRLAWEILKLPHHCSYLSLSNEKGKEKTNPVPEVRWLIEEQGAKHGIIVSPSKPIPSDDSDDQPPHRQAANYYKGVMDDKEGDFVVTMEHPSRKSPAPLVIEISKTGATLKKSLNVGGAAAVSRQAPRAGKADGI